MVTGIHESQHISDCGSFSKKDVSGESKKVLSGKDKKHSSVHGSVVGQQLILGLEHEDASTSKAGKSMSGAGSRQHFVAPGGRSKLSNPKEVCSEVPTSDQSFLQGIEHQSGGEG